jgi:pimeloyl-ACP methyl ester carboxylesterase
LGNAGGGGIDAIVERAMNLSAAGKFLWPLPDRGLRKRFSFIEAPTLVIAGEGDQLVPPRYCEEFAGAIAGARMATVAGAGHYPTVEQCEATRSLVAEFLAG